MTLPTHNRRRAYTLIELLVVVVILITLVAIALPLARKVLDDSYVREASRQLNGYFAMAKVHAVRTGRPHGLFMQCDAPVGLTAGTTPLRQITRLYLAEVQPPYAGGTTNSRAQISTVNGVSEFFATMVGDTTQSPPSPAGRLDTTEMNPQTGLGYLYALIERGETFFVRFDYKGEWYRCVRGPAAAINPIFTDATKFYYLGTRSGLGYPLPPGGGLSGTTYDGPSAPAAVADYAVAKPFQILRGPRRVGNPLELTGGACIDLTYCGIGPTGSGIPTPAQITAGTFNLCGFPLDSPPAVPPAVQSLIVLFSPGGGVEEIYVNTARCTPQGSVHFLIGRVDKVNLPLGANATHASMLNMFDPQTSNLADANSLWVSVGRANGTVTTAENAPNLALTDYTYAGQSTYLAVAREFATGREQMGGR